jgi:carbamoyl-phosphate synthase large subunit
LETHNGAIPFPKLKSDDYLLYSSYRGKELGLQLKSCSDALFDLSVVISLGFTGNFSQWKISDPLPKYSHWYLEDKKNDVKVVFSCKRKLSRITLGEFNEKRSVGIDNQFWVESLRRNCFYKLPSIKKPIYEFLMDQKYANGMGNYMRAEILGTSTESIDLAENRERCEVIVRELAPLGLEQPSATIASTREEAIERARDLGYPVLVRPSYVLGGKAMRIVHSENDLKQWIDEALLVSGDKPVLIDRFLDRATEVDVDAISDGRECFIGGLMEHIEEAGIHSGDSACSLPPVTLPVSITDRIRTYTRELAKKLKVVGLMNAQFAIQGDRIFLLEVNPRASRTVPFISKAIGKPLAKLAVQVMIGKTLADLGIHEDLDQNLQQFYVKAPVFPFNKFPGVDVLLGPEMKSTGEVMGHAPTFAGAYYKALSGAGMTLPKTGTVFISVRNEDKAEVLSIARHLNEMGFKLVATQGTAKFLNSHYLHVEEVNKASQGSPHAVEMTAEGRFSLVINTVSDEKAVLDSFAFRRAALDRKIPYATVLASARAMVQAIRENRKNNLGVLHI